MHYCMLQFLHNGRDEHSRIWLSFSDQLVLLIPKLYIIWVSNLSILNVPDEGYSRNGALRTKFDIYVFMVIHVK